MVVFTKILWWLFNGNMKNDYVRTFFEKFELLVSFHVHNIDGMKMTAQYFIQIIVTYVTAYDHDNYFINILRVS